jgi:hypothetical protein
MTQPLAAPRNSPAATAAHIRRGQEPAGMIAGPLIFSIELIGVVPEVATTAAPRFDILEAAARIRSENAMVGEAFAGLSALKTAFDLAKGLKDINDAALRNAAVIELQEKILSAQQTQSALAEQVGELEKEVARLKDWEAEKKRYQLTELGPGIVAFSIKDVQTAMPVARSRICSSMFAVSMSMCFNATFAARN